MLFKLSTILDLNPPIKNNTFYVSQRPMFAPKFVVSIIYRTIVLAIVFQNI